MAEILIWTGAVDGDYANASNWIDDATGVASLTSPVATDTIIFDRGNVNVDTNLSPSGTLAKIVGTNGYAGIVAPGSVLTVPADDIEWAAGSINHSGSVSGFSKWAPRQGTVANINGGPHANLVLQRASANIAAATVVTNAFIDGGTVNILDNATDITSVSIRGNARVSSARDAKYDIGAQSILTAKEGCTLNTGTVIQDGGMIKYLSAETIADLLVSPNGMFDASQSSRTFTLTLLNRWLNARINLFTKSGPVTPGTENVYGIGGYSVSESPLSPSAPI